MTKRNITVAGIALILLIAIAITIVLGLGKAAPVSIGTLHSHALKLEQLDLQQASLDLRLLDKAPANLTVALTNKLDTKLNHLNVKLNNKLGDKLNDQLDAPTLNSLTADANGLALRLDLAGRLKDGAPLAALGGGLTGKLLSA
jgi:hypothetical protein